MDHLMYSFLQVKCYHILCSVLYLIKLSSLRPLLLFSLGFVASMSLSSTPGDNYSSSLSLPVYLLYPISNQRPASCQQSQVALFLPFILGFFYYIPCLFRH